MKDFRKILQDLKLEMLDIIEKAVGESEEYELDFTELGNSPIVQRGEDDNLTYTLDRIYMEEGELMCSCSSCWNSMTIPCFSLDTDVLVAIIEDLED